MIQTKLAELFQSWKGVKPDSIVQLPQSGSNRQYYRLSSSDQSAIAVYNEDLKENKAFVGFSEHFFQKGIKVPQIYAVDPRGEMYLQEDLGDTNLYGLLKQPFPNELKSVYKKVLQQLILMQTKGGEGLDYDLCYPVKKFDRQSILWDLNYFKYYFLKTTDTSFHEANLEKDFQNFADDLLRIPMTYFMHRDFQSRNIMIKSDEIYFIDYQGGRKGPLQYDLASLLYQAKAAIPQETREELLDYYFTLLKEALPETEFHYFEENFYSIVLVRTLQVLGAYGFRGIFERKEHFIKSIPFALDNLELLMNKGALPEHYKELTKACRKILELDQYRHQAKKEKSDKLLVSIHSFSYKRGIPKDNSGNGGGYVFDCRNIFNPGRFQEYKKLTGRDQPVIEFLETKSGIQDFLDPVYKLIDSTVETYIERKFQNLSVSFGCTGGQHRSVYSADSLAKRLKEKYDVEIALHHVEQELKGWVN